MEDEYFLKGYDEVLTRCDELYQMLEDRKDNMSDKDYMNYKYNIDMQKYNTIEQRETTKSMYDNMYDKQDKLTYYNCDRILNGAFGNKDIVQFNGSVGDLNDIGSFASEFNNFYKTKKGKIADNRTFDVSEELFNDIIKECEINGIDLYEYGIVANAPTHKFSIPHDTKSFIKFSQIYYNVTDRYPLKGFTMNTADEFPFTSEYEYYMGDNLLKRVGESVNNIQQRKIDIEKKYGLGEFYMPILQQFTDDITVETMRRAGYKDYEINNQQEICINTLKSLDPGSVQVYAAESTVDSGGREPLRLITDGKIKQDIFNDIFRNIGEEKVEDGKKTGKLSMSFCTLGEMSGTTVMIPKKGENSYYQVFIPDALPSKLKEEFDNNPSWKYSSIVNTWDAQANYNISHHVNIGAAFDGAFHAFGNGGFAYVKDNKVVNDRVSKQDIVEITYGSDMLRQLAITRNSVPENRLTEFDAEAANVIIGGLAQSISNITDTPIETVIHDLSNYYYKYYSR